MTVFTLLSTHYSQYLFLLKEAFPSMLETAKKTPVFPWKEEYNIADKNPEIIETIKHFESLLLRGLITEKEFQDKLSSVKFKYASRTEGIAFINEGFVSFRDEKPSMGVILHELGHIHFKENDYIWGALYGGGEKLFWLGLKKDYNFKVKEKHVSRSTL
jgi:hypothetical protein